TNLHDPTGLQPITTEQLDAYRKANSPKWGTALAIAAGIGLAFVPGAQGFAAALFAGAVLGGGASLIDQACSGYPINPQQVVTDALWGVAGGAAGWGLGKAFQWAAKTPLGQSAIGWARQQANKVPVLRDVIHRLGPNGRPSRPGAVDLASPQRRTHILDGDATGGGHRWPGLPGKTPFPRHWSDDRIMETISEIATDPAAYVRNQTGPPNSLTTNAGSPAVHVMESTKEGVPIRVITKPLSNDGIVTGFPTKWPPVRATPGELALRNELALATSKVGEE
ncbi:EndoU domain-containing protein, partial [Arachnia propionica]